MKVPHEMEARLLTSASSVRGVNAAALARPKAPTRRRTGHSGPAIRCGFHWLVELGIPGMQIRSEMNARGHWSARHRRFKAQSLAVGIALAVADMGQSPAFASCVVTLTRVGRRMDDDNLAGGFKAVRDRLAEWLGADDGDGRIEWRYDQRPGPAGVLIRIEGRS